MLNVDKVNSSDCHRFVLFPNFSISQEFETSWIRLIDEQPGSRDRRRQLALGVYRKYVEVGNFLDNQEKDELAFQLKDCIIRRWFPEPSE